MVWSERLNTLTFLLIQEKFPPNIYYKIFTQRPIQDLCANSPKNYTCASAKQLKAKELHNRLQPLPPADGELLLGN